MSREREVGAREVPLPVLRRSLELLQQWAHMVKVLQIVSRLTRFLLEHANVSTAIILNVAFSFELARPQELEDDFVLSVVAQIEQKVDLMRLTDALEEQVHQLLLLDAGRLHLKVAIAQDDVRCGRAMAICLPVVLLEHLLDGTIELLNEHGRVLRLRVLEVPDEAGLALLDERPVDILSKALHDLSHLLLPREVGRSIAAATRITKLLPLQIVARRVQVARFGGQPKVRSVCSQLVVLQEPILHAGFVVVSYNDDSVPRVRHQAVQLVDDFDRGN